MLNDLLGSWQGESRRLIRFVPSGVSQRWTCPSEPRNKSSSFSVARALFKCKSWIRYVIVEPNRMPNFQRVLSEVEDAKVICDDIKNCFRAIDNLYFALLLNAPFPSRVLCFFVPSIPCGCGLCHMRCLLCLPRESLQCPFFSAEVTHPWLLMSAILRFLHAVFPSELRSSSFSSTTLICLPCSV